MTARPKAVTKAGTIFDGVECYVLDDGRRVLSQRGIVRALASKNAEENRGPKNADLDRFLTRLPEENRELSAVPKIEFTVPGHGVAHGREASFFVRLCRAYVDAFIAGRLHHKQHGLAINAMRIVSVLAEVGIEALVDEATGYQKVRADNTLAELANRLLRETPSVWARLWPDSLIRELAKLYGVQWDGGSFPPFLKKTEHDIYNIVLGKDVADIMRLYNENPKANRHHQHLADEARAGFARQLEVVEVLARQSANGSDFYERMRAHYRGEPLQLSLMVLPSARRSRRAGATSEAGAR